MCLFDICYVFCLFSGARINNEESKTTVAMLLCIKGLWNNRGNGKYMQVQADVLVTVFSRF